LCDPSANSIEPGKKYLRGLEKIYLNLSAAVIVYKTHDRPADADIFAVWMVSDSRGMRLMPRSPAPAEWLLLPRNASFSLGSSAPSQDQDLPSSLTV
jgi:hypothetical protein